MKKFVALLTKGKQLKINGKMVTQTFFELYKSVMLKVLNIWTSSQIKQKTMVLTFLQILCICAQAL